MTCSLSNLDNNLAKQIQRIKCKYRNGNKNVKYAELNTKVASAFLNIQNLKKLDKI